MDDRSPGPVGEPRQRWRVVFGHDPDAENEARSDPVEAWTKALGAAGIPLAIGGGKGGRARISFGAPLPTGMAGEAELADLVLTERRTRSDIAARLTAGLPPGDRLVDLFDVWLGAPALAGHVVAADFRVTIRATPSARIADACSAVLAAPTLERTRSKGPGRAVSYDLRPLVLDLAVAPGRATGDRGDSEDHAPDRDTTLVRMRLRIAQDGAAGRPGEVVLALGEVLGEPLDVAWTVRERLLTGDEPASIVDRAASPSVSRPAWRPSSTLDGARRV